MDLDASDPSEDMAALMGFSSFGAAPKPKKRKYNPAVENAVTDASLTVQERKQQQQQHKDYRPSSEASGGNSIPLGKGRVVRKGGRNESRAPGEVGQPDGGIRHERTDARGVAAAGKGAASEGCAGTRGSGEREVAREDDGPRDVDTSATPPVDEDRVTALGSEEGDGDATRYVDTSRPPPLHAVPVPAAELPPNEVGRADLRHSDQLAVQQQRQAPHARRLMDAEGRGGGDDKAGVAPGGGHDWRALRKGVVSWRGDVAYYDESFVENPWRELLVAGGERGAEGDGHG